MMEYTLTQDKLAIKVNDRGAELQSLIWDGFEYLWQGDKKHWSDRSPVLFPIIGGLPQGTYTLKGISYALSGHGFAKVCDWVLKDKSSSRMTFLLSSSAQTREQFPFDFDLETSYELDGNTLGVSFELLNRSSETMTFSLGGHPGFNCPLDEGLSLEDYGLRFEKKETSFRRLKGKNLLTGKKEIILEDKDYLPLSHELFDRGALIMDDLRSGRVTLESPGGKRKVTMNYEGFPYLGIWKKAFTKAPFICLEPWFGVDSTEGDSGRWEDKEGLENLEKGEIFRAAYSITLT